MAVYGLFDAIFSWVVGKFGRRLGRITLLTVAFLLDIGNYLYLIFWTPTDYILFSVLIMYVTFGSSDGILQTIITGRSCNNLFATLKKGAGLFFYYCVGLRRASVQSILSF